MKWDFNSLLQFNYGVPIFVVFHNQPISIKDAKFIFVTSDIETSNTQAKSKVGGNMFRYMVGQILHLNT